MVNYIGLIYSTIKCLCLLITLSYNANKQINILKELRSMIN